MNPHDIYKPGHHPTWCELGDCLDHEDSPNHVGRRSQMFAQLAEARLTLQLSRNDDTVPAGHVPGEVKVRLTLVEGINPIGVYAEMTIDETRAAALLLAQYVEHAERAQQFTSHYSREVIEREGSM